MPIIKSAIKRMRQTAKRRARNVTTKRNVRRVIKALGVEQTATNLSKAQSELDKAVKKHVLHKNVAARKMAQLAKATKTAGAAKPKAAVTKKAAPAKKPAATAKKTTAKKA